MIIGKNIHELRKKRKLSQEEIAEKINVTRQTVSNWETGQTVPDLYQAKELAKVLEISIDELFENIEENLKIQNNKYDNKIMVNASIIWNEIKLNLLEYDISKVSYQIWFEPIIDAQLIDNKFIIYTNEPVAVKHINEHYQEKLLKLIQTHYSKDIKEVIVKLECNKKEKNLTKEEMIEELEIYYEAAGFKHIYERELKRKTDEEIKKLYKQEILDNE